MSGHFDRDSLPGRPRLLFLGWAYSSHTHAWIDLVREDFNTRLYALPLGFPPEDWPVRTYITQSTARTFDPEWRRKLYPFNKIDRDLRNWLTRAALGQGTDAPRHGLAKVIRSWRPHVIHVLGLNPAGHFASETRERFGLNGPWTWVLQLRGGSDLALAHADPALRDKLARTLAGFDQIVSDNLVNPRLCEGLGIPPERFASLTPVPGTGGVDVEGLNSLASTPPGRRRDIIFPKAYECPWSKSLPVLEALRLCGDSLGEARIHMLAVDAETENWCRLLPEAIRERLSLRPRIPRAEALALMAKCRVMLAPSLVDGVPNCLYEAMACGSLPIVSPLTSITPLVREGENVLFAPNLRPDKLAEAIIRAVTDDGLVANAGRANLELVRQLADRAATRARVTAWYAELTSQD